MSPKAHIVIKWVGALVLALAATLFVVGEKSDLNQQDRIDRNSYGACVASGAQHCVRPPGAPVEHVPGPSPLPMLPTPTRSGP